MAVHAQKEDVYATLLMNDAYLPGALTAARSLKDAGTRKKLAVLITTDTLSAQAVTELQNVFDHIIPVSRLVNTTGASLGNLHLMGRPDLHSSFTKIALWQQEQFRKIVYFDCDIVALRAPDELFDLPYDFCAAPDIGWPDIFNTGVMALKPDRGIYYALEAMATRGISFDGADQGLLNMYFKNTFHRLDFTYNVTPSAHYQYLPAYRHFQSSISIAHFIGKEKPWTRGRVNAGGATPYDELLSRWWAVYDRHYKHFESDFVRSLVAGEQPQVHPRHVDFAYTVSEHESSTTHDQTTLPERSTFPEPENADAPQHEEQSEATSEPPHESDGLAAEEPEEEPVHVIPQNTWDPRTEPPPTNSAPEASNFPSTQYEMSTDSTPYQPPRAFPQPPKNLDYALPKDPPSMRQAPRQIFPWESWAPPATRYFPEDDVVEEIIEADEPAMEDAPTAAITGDATVPASQSESSLEQNPQSTTESPPLQSPASEIEAMASRPWYDHLHGRTNAWDDDVSISKFMDVHHGPRKAGLQVLFGGTSDTTSPKKRSMRLTDFPTMAERPSLPVTPMPVRKGVFWGSDKDESSDLPAAEGVPSQAEWDPGAKLEELARHQADVIANKLGRDPSPTREIPQRSLPFGSEGIVSPSYHPPQPVQHSVEEVVTIPAATPRTILEPTFHGPGLSWEKGEEDIIMPHGRLPPKEDDLDALA